MVLLQLQLLLVVFHCRAMLLVLEGALALARETVILAGISELLRHWSALAYVLAIPFSTRSIV